MPDLRFEKLDWKDFERLCADLLDAEGFIVQSEPFVDRMGADIIAVEVYQSHDPSREIPGDEVLARVRKLLSEHLPSS